MVISENTYDISFQSNAEMIYEYSYVNISLLIQLSIEDYSYSGLYAIPQGFQIKWVINSIIENSNEWIVSATVYRGESFSELAGDFQTSIYKTPEALSYELFNGTGNELYFIPLNVSEYLVSVNQSIPIPNQSYSYTINNSIIFDYTQLGSNDTVRHEFNACGIMTHYQIFYNGSLAFTLELKRFSLGGIDPILVSIAITISVSAILIITYTLLKKRRSKQSKQNKTLQTKKILKKLK